MDDGEVFSGETCSLREVLDLVGDKWAIRVLVQLGHGPRPIAELPVCDRLGERQLCAKDRHGVDGHHVTHAGCDPQRIHRASGQRLAEGTRPFEGDPAFGIADQLEANLLEPG